MHVRTAAAAALFLVALVPACQREEGGQSKPAPGTSVAKAASGAPTLELFVMSQCPYGVQVVNAAAAAKKQLGSAMDVKIQFIGDGTPGQLTSMHGPAEVTGDLAQVCANEIAADKLLSFVTCQNENMSEVDKNWRDCAQKNGVDVGALEQCMNGDQGQKLLAASFDEAKKRGAQGSPTMFLDGKPYEGGRKPRDFVRAVCDSAKGEKPEACAKLPEPPKVSAIFLSDTRCKECEIRGLEPRLRAELGGLVVEHVDYATDKGKALYKELAAAGSKTLPTVLLGPEVEKDTEGYPNIKRFLREVGSYRELGLGGRWDPTAEICDNNNVDDDGDGKADCKDEGCAESMVCRPTKAKKLDMFVMSQCPYGAKAMIAAKTFTDHFKGDVALDVHFIGDDRGGQLASMHGPAEVDEDVREHCAHKLYPKNHQFMRYLACRSHDYQNPEWKQCASDAGMDPAAIQKCFDGEGKTGLGKSFALSSSLGIASSPTFLVNNKRQFNAIAASQIQKEYCQDNPDVAACKQPIVDPAGSEAEAAAAQQGGAQCN
jgi:2-hydroxychromene-2-carboxylate isomerase